MHRIPPKNAIAFLRWFCRADYLDEIEGDLIQLYQGDDRRKPSPLWFWMMVIRHLRFEFIRSLYLTNLINIMFTHHLLITFRNARRYKSSFLINLIGLAGGLTSVLLIWLWVQDELRTDKFHRSDDQLYLVMKTSPEADGVIETYNATPSMMGRMMKDDYPEIARYVSCLQRDPGIVNYQGKKFKSAEQFVSEDFFSVFSFPLLHGNPQQVLKDNRSVVVSESLARKMFGTADNAIGKLVEWEWRDPFNGPYTISGVFRDIPGYSTMKFDIVFSFDLYLQLTNDTNWFSNNAKTYIVLKEGTDVTAFQQKVRQYSREKLVALHGKDGLQWEGEVVLQQYSRNYLHGEFREGKEAGGRIQYVRLFTTVAIVILVIACINFMNLSTAQASRRMKEIGVRKTIGAGRRILITQHLTEAVILSVLALLIAAGAAWMLLPFFSAITEKELHFSFSTEELMFAVGVCLLTGLLSGSYPALFLSGLHPVSVLKGVRTSLFGEAFIRQTLVVFQFATTLVLIVAVIIVYQQIEFIQSRDLGFERRNLIVIPNDGKIMENLQTYLTELRRIPGVVRTSSMNGDLVGKHSGGGGIEWEGKVQGVEFDGYYVNYEMVELLGLKLTQGKAFNEANNDLGKVIFNETAIRVMGLKDPVGKVVTMWGQKREIAGVVKDFHYQSLYHAVAPCFMVCDTRSMDTYVRVNPGSEYDVLRAIESVYHKINPGLDFEYHFVDEDFERMYASENRVAMLSRCFAGVAIVISCLGLFGLTSFTAARRTKEMAIRKLFGATQANVMMLLSSDFFRLVMIAIIFSIPVSFYLGTSWLSLFAYRAGLHWYYFVGAALCAIGISAISVMATLYSTANKNPVQGLKTE